MFSFASSRTKIITLVHLNSPSLLVRYYKKSQRNHCEYTRSHFRFKHFGCNMYFIFKLHHT
uniref:Uncharacterized protein n=1 Tax=Helianthus annuus TaxID=4232 RepID=A0A251SH28_HELAN